MLDLTYETPTPKTIAGAKGDYELVIGLEVHAQVSSNAKLFSGASTQFGAEPNSNVAFVDAGMPGMLPVINEYCVEQAVRTGLGLKAEINLTSAFDRKNYFYPDLPQGYQISQLYHPIVGEGEVLVEMGEGIARLVRIERIHLEQDAGKSIHDMDPNMSFVDLNRTGVALMEIVSRPDIRGPEEAAAYVLKLRQILRYLGTCDGNMQNGNLRADVNVSICKPGDYEKYQATQDFSHLGTRCEIKNMNSTRFIQAAIDVEARRQIAIIEDGGEVVQETRLYDPDKNETRSMEEENADFFEKVAAGRDGKLAANWVINELFGRLKKDEKEITESPVSPDQLGGIIGLITAGDISGKIAKELFEIVYTEGGDPAQIVEDRGMKQVTDMGAIEAAVDEIIAANPAQVEKAKANPKLAGWFVGQVMKATGGKANPAAVNKLVSEKLKA